MEPLVLALAFVGVAAAAYIALGVWVSRRRYWCPQCRNKRLRRVTYLRCNPPPNYSFFTCDNCGGQFVRADRYDGVENPLVPRAGSNWEHSPAWGGPPGLPR
jgi:hypothetical protein